MRQPLRVCQTTQLRPEMRDRYLELHTAVWDSVEAGIRAAHIENYSIFVHGDTLVAYFEYTGDDLAADLAVLDEDPQMQRWLALTDPCQVDPEPDRPGGPWRELTLAWHLSRG